MGRICYARTLLDVELSNTLIQSIIAQGSKLGLKYYNYTTIDSLSKKNILSMNETVDILLKKFSESQNGTWDKSISIDFILQNNREELSADLEFDYKNDNLTHIELVSLGSPWYKQHNQGYDIIDWRMYITVLLELCKDFAILEISTDDEYFNWP